jgi:hypothetical protein
VAFGASNIIGPGFLFFMPRDGAFFFFFFFRNFHPLKPSYAFDICINGTTCRDGCHGLMELFLSSFTNAYVCTYMCTIITSTCTYIHDAIPCPALAWGNGSCCHARRRVVKCKSLLETAASIWMQRIPTNVRYRTDLHTIVLDLDPRLAFVNGFILVSWIKPRITHIRSILTVKTATVNLPFLAIFTLLLQVNLNLLNPLLELLHTTYVAGTTASVDHGLWSVPSACNSFTQCPSPTRLLSHASRLFYIVGAEVLSG